MMLPLTLVSTKQWDGQVGNGHFFPTWASLSQWGIKFLFIEIYGKNQNNNFQKKKLFNITKFNGDMPRQLKKPVGLTCGFFLTRPLTWASLSQWGGRVFIKKDGFFHRNIKKIRTYKDRFNKPVRYLNMLVDQTGEINPFLLWRV